MNLALNLADDFTPGTGSALNDLVPEARLSPPSTGQFARTQFSVGLHLSGDRDWPIKVMPEIGLLKGTCN